MLIVDAPIEVSADPAGRPRAFRWRGHRYVVDMILDEWEELGEWWDQDPPEQRSVFRVLAEGGVYELDFRRPQRQWFLYRVWD